MRTITYRLKDFEEEKKIITIGFVGENDHTKIRIDCSEAYAEYPNAIASLAVSPPRGESYPVVVNVDGEYVEWTIKNSDVAYHGNGEAQLTFIQDNVVKKEYSFYTKILKSIAPDGSAPSAIQAWIDAANEALGTIEGAVQDAEDARDAAIEAQGKAEVAQGKAEDAQTAAETSERNASASETAAETAEENAEKWATGGSEGTPSATNNAKYYSEHAAGSATDAGNSANAADGSATTAGQKSLVSEGFATGQQNGSDVDSASPYYHNSAKYYKDQAKEISDSIDGMTVEAETLQPGSSATAEVTEVSGNKHIAFGIPKGEKGETGSTPAISIGTVTTGAAGTNAAASITGTPENPVLNLTIPQGLKGDAGNGTMLAPNYADLTFPVKKGQHCLQNGNYYVALVDIQTSEAFTASHWKSTQVGVEVNNLKSAIVKYNSFDLLKDVVQYNDRTLREVTFTWDSANSTCEVSGTARGGNSYTNLYTVSGNNILPPFMVPGGRYVIHYKTTDSNILLTFGVYINGTYSYYVDFTEDGVLDIPSDCTGIYIRLEVRENKTANGVVSDIAILTAYTNNELEELIDNIQTNVLPEYTHAIIGNVLPNDGDANNYKDNTVYMVSAPNQIEHLPSTDAGVLVTYKVYNYAFQFFTAHTASGDSHMYVRRCTLSNSTWTDWKEIGHGISQTINQYSNTYNITASPTITTDTNNYLASTGDNTDRKADIATMLSETGTCHLGTGDFYVSGVDMVEDSAIIGSGPKTRIILLGTDSTEGYAIKMKSRCTVKNLTIAGNTTDHSSNSDTYPKTAEFVNRHGILWQGNYSTTGTDIQRRGIVSECYICNFTGGGIVCNDNGMNVISGLNVTDCIIWYCYAGIYNPYVAEFNRFENVVSTNCYYGVVNNGGNNCFANCNFSKNVVGFLLDNTNSQAPNNGHGSVVNCIFDHSDGNTGVGIHLIGVTPGEVFTGCQLFYSKIIIENSNGVNFVGLNAGNAETITVTGGTLVMFSQCVFRTAPTISVTSNDKVKFIDCYTHNGTAVTVS